MIHRTIHHFEDEPELVRWIPSALLNRYWLNHPEWIVDEGKYAEDDEQLVTTFELAPSGKRCVITYRLYRTFADFDERFTTAVQADDVALVDLMGAASAREPIGLRVYEAAVAALGSESVFFLTAFPRELTTFIEDARVITKPPDASQLIDLLVEKLRVGE